MSLKKAIVAALTVLFVGPASIAYAAKPISRPTAIAPTVCKTLDELYSPTQEELIAGLPDKIKTPKTSEDLMQLFSIAKAEYATGFDVAKVRRLALAVQKNQGSAISKNDAKSLKKLRKLTQVMRSSFILFSNDHVCPYEFDDFVRYFGKMNTRAKKLSSNDIKGSLKDIKKANKFAARVLEHLDLAHDKINAFAVQPSTPESFAAHMALMKDKILTSVSTAEMRVVDYHDLRKWVRDFKIMSDLQLQKANTRKTRAVADFLEYINKYLGDTKDQLKDEEEALIAEEQRLQLQAETGVATEPLRTSVDPTIRHMIETFFSRL